MTNTTPDSIHGGAIISVINARRDPVLMVTLFTWLLVPCVALAALGAGTPVFSAGGAAAAFATAASLGVRLLQGSVWQPAAAAMGLMGQAIAMTAAFAMHPWQIDSHMMFFGSSRLS